MKEKLDFKILNYFLQDQEPYYLPNFLYSANKLKKTKITKKKAKANKNSIHLNKDKDNLNINRCNKHELISSCCNTHYQKSNNLTPFQKITQYNDNFKKFNIRGIKSYINKDKIGLIPKLNTDRNFYSKTRNKNSYENHSSPKEYINKIKLYKINNNRYNNIRTDLYYFYLHKNQIKFNNIDIDHLTIENKEKNSNKKLGNSRTKIKIDEKSNTNLDKNKMILESINNDIKYKLYSLKKYKNKKFRKNNYDELIHNIKTNIINSPIINTKVENKSKRNIYSDSIHDLYLYNSKYKDKLKKYNSVNLNGHLSLKANYSQNSINNLKKCNNISSLFFPNENHKNGRNKSRNYINCYNSKESKTFY